MQSNKSLRSQKITKTKIIGLTFIYDQLKCPTCGTVCGKHDIVHRWVKGCDLEQIKLYYLTISVHSCKNCKANGVHPYSFRPSTDGLVEKYKRNSNQVINLIKKSVVRDKSNYHTTARRMREDFHLSTVPGTVWKAINNDTTQLDKDFENYQCKAIFEFSGQLSIDESYVGDFALVAATDSLNERELGHIIVEGGVTKRIIKDFLIDLKKKGLNNVAIVNRDGSPLYPEVIEEVFQGSKQKECDFHLKQQAIRAAKKVFTKERNKIKIPKMKQGKTCNPAELEEREYIKKQKEKKTMVFKNRKLIGQKEHNKKDNQVWQQMILFMPILITIRACLLDLYDTLSSSSVRELVKKRKVWLNKKEYQESCADILKVLSNRKHVKYWVSHLLYENAQKTSNDVERHNRAWKQRQQGHYRLRLAFTNDTMMKLDVLERDRRNQRQMRKLIKINRMT